MQARGLILDCGLPGSCTTTKHAKILLRLLLQQQGKFSSVYGVIKNYRLEEGASRLLDCGFGFGDSLLLWLDHFVVDNIVGVNITESECLVAVSKLQDIEPQQRDNVSIRCNDAVKFVRESKFIQKSGFDRIVVVDSLYHFNTRADFILALSDSSESALKDGGRFAAGDILGTVDFCVGNDITQISYMRIARNPLRFTMLLLVSIMAGVPLKNLLYSEATFQHWVEDLKFEAYSSRDVSSMVFIPFSVYTLNRAWTRKASITDAITLAATSLFMKMLFYSGLVKFYIYGFTKS